MFDIESALEQEISNKAQNRPTVIFVEAMDPRVLEAVFHLSRYVRPVLLAPEKEIRFITKTHLRHIDENRVNFVLAESVCLRVKDQTELLAEFAKAALEIGDPLVAGMDLEQATLKMAEPAVFGVMATRLGHADMVVGGATHEPRDFIRPALRLLANRDVLCEAGVFVLPDKTSEQMFPHNIAVFGDVAVNASMTPETLAEVAVGTCCIARDVIPEHILPRIHGAIVSYSNRGSDDGPSPELVREAMKLVPERLAQRVAKQPRYGTIDITGEIKVSVALSSRSAAYYSNGDPDDPNDPASVIICPNLDMGNLMYHLHGVWYPDAKKFAVLFGVASRVVDLAMDTNTEDIRLAVKATTLRLLSMGWEKTPLDTFFPLHKILAINPGSTSTKIAVYENDVELFTKEIQHSASEIAPFEGQPITSQFRFRKDAVLAALAERGLEPGDMSAIAARGGLIYPIPHGTYWIDELMLADLKACVMGQHASNLGALIAAELVHNSNIPAFIVDPPTVDEVLERVRITGVKRIRRRVISHALNQIATAHRFAADNETFYDQINVVVAHMGGGISIGAHKRGHYIDVNDGLDGEGPFSPQRSGSLPVGQLIDLCFSGQLSEAEIRKLNLGRGGLIDLLGTTDLREVEDRISKGDQWAKDVFEAMCYQISKAITALLPAFDGEPIDKVLLTGGMARSQALVDSITKLVSALGCGVAVYPGENEMIALVKGALRVLNKREQARDYASLRP